ncbi:MAG TPA: mechanosensitive ion channel domain-containing protein [Gemmatimonadaceae bacterium]|nr:mechanosensitive ion channel domain-containing protein [Gemmatimonadaceae bacterium]
MSFRRHVPLVVLAALLVAAVYGVILTRQHPPAAARATVRRAAQGGSLVVDESSLQTVQALLRLPTSPEERESARSALRLADKAGDLAFAQAVWRMAARPPAANASAREIDSRLQNALRTLAADKAAVDQLTAAMAKASVADAARMKDQLELAKAMATLDQDEVDDAEQDLVTAGGNPQTGFEEMIRQHDAASQASDTLRIAVTPFDIKPGLVSQVSAWQSVRDKRTALGRARAAADSTATALRQRHDSIQARATRRLQPGNASGLTHDSATALVAEARRQSLREKALGTLDRRVDNQQQLAAAFASWSTIVEGQERAAINRVLRSIATLLAIALVGILLLRWAERTTSSLSMDRRRIHTLRMVGRVTLQVLGLLLVLLVIFGPPSNLGTFLGLAGAGLTVALKDFIVGFIGWFALMGADGIRPGDLVEINGVTGEVVELGMFQTVLLETGAWAGSGHPTGRRVTFNNSFAIEGHYFNFSTTGQWLWDEIQIVVPDGRDPYPVSESLRSEVEAATAESARQAEIEWKGARRTPQFATLAATPTVNLRPIPGGAEITVRYVTRLSERAAVRSRLYRAAIDLLGAAARV